MKNNDCFKDYLIAMGRHPLLSAVEEIELSKKVQFLRDLEKLKSQSWNDITDEELAQLMELDTATFAKRLAIAQRAKNRLVECNLRLVVSVAKKYLHRGMPIDDLVQEGALGLTRGVELFDHTRGYKFSTYAYWWIRQGITRALAEKNATIRLPIHINEALSKIRKTRKHLAAKNDGRAPTLAELAEAANMSEARILEVISSSQKVFSLDAKVGPGQDTELGEFAAFTTGGIEEVEEDLFRQYFNTVLDGVMLDLNEKERDVLNFRYGRATGEEMTLAEVGRQMNLSRERVRQIHVKAVRKLRGKQIKDRLQPLMEEVAS